MAVEIAPHFVVNHFTLANVYVAMVSMLSRLCLVFGEVCIQILFPQVGILREQHSQNKGGIRKRIYIFLMYFLRPSKLSITHLILEGQCSYKLASGCCLQSFVKTIANS